MENTMDDALQNSFERCNFCNSCNPCNCCNSCEENYSTKINLGTVRVIDQTVNNGEAIKINGSNYQNGITIMNDTTIKFMQKGLYSIQFVVTVASNQPGPIDISFNVYGGSYASGRTNSTASGLEVTGIGFVKVDTVPATGQLINHSNQSIAIDFLRLTIIKLS